MEMKYFVRLPLKRAYNVRDLGGNPAASGRITSWRVFLRADDLCNLEDDDIQFLLDYGVKTVVDLRSKEEVRAKPNPFALNEKVIYANIPLMNNAIEDAIRRISGTENPGQCLTDSYLDFIKNSSGVLREVFVFFAEQNDGCTLFHCAGGKDRTGLMAMLLLGLAGVNKYDIMANYETTYSYLRLNPEFQANLAKYPLGIMCSKSDYIEPLIDYIVDTYGDFAKFLLSIGIPEDCLARIRKRLV